MAQVLQPFGELFPTNEYPQLLVGLGAPDDAAVYQLSEERALITTTDFFPPVVDDAYHFGAIAAANALSDVYAMGGTPLMAMNLAAFPDGLDLSILSEIMRGGAEKVREAGAVIAGGHTVADKEPKYGLAVTGEIHPQRIITKGGAQVGDVLLLTKPLGTGVLTTALKRQIADAAQTEAVIAGMSRLNRDAAQVAQRYNDDASVVHAMTDITGYGLAGHGHEMAHLSDVDFHIQYDALRWYAGTLTHAEADVFPGGLHRNRDYFAQWLTIDATLAAWQQYLLYDPQTSGGLLMAVAAEFAQALLADLHAAGDTDAAVIGEVVAGTGKLYIR